jgi:hypothetical protein
VLNSVSTRTYRLAMVLAASLAAAGFTWAQGPAGAGTSGAITASALPAQPVANATTSGDASANALPTAANASRAAAPDTGGSYSDNDDYISGDQRALWVIQSSVGWQSLAYGVIPAGVGTALNHPREYGTHWEGFGDRYGMRLAGLATSNTMEASLGAIWHENPRYKPEPEKSFGGRVESVIYQTFFTRRPDGNFEPAYARFLAIPGSNFLSNTWRANSEADTSHALERTGYGFAGAMGSNAFHEFWPTVKSHLHM